MTMIASLHLNNVPIIVGDLLMSDSIRPKEMVLPTFSEDVIPYLSPASHRHPVKFNQKIYILKPNVCIAFAGVVSSFKQLLEDVRQFCRYHEAIISEMLFDFLNERRDDTWDDFDCLIYVADQVGGNYYLGEFKHGNWLRKQTPLYGDVWSIGSGALDFIHQALETGSFKSADSDNELHKIITSNALMICRILSLERLTLSNIEKYWGAGFELVYFSDGQFRKLDNITYVINYVSFESNRKKKFPFPVVIMNYKYHGDNLIITVIKPGVLHIKSEDNKIVIKSKDILVNQFSVIAIDSMLSDNDELNAHPSFESLYCSSSYIMEDETSQKIPTVFQGRPDIEIEFNSTDGLTYAFDTRLIDFLKSIA